MTRRRQLYFLTGVTIGALCALFPALVAWLFATLWIVFLAAVFLGIVFGGCALLDRWARVDADPATSKPSGARA